LLQIISRKIQNYINLIHFTCRRSTRSLFVPAAIADLRLIAGQDDHEYSKGCAVKQFNRKKYVKSSV